MPVTDYNAGIDSSEFLITYRAESEGGGPNYWGVNPGGTFDTMRLTSESLSENKTRNRPQEINADGYAQDAVTTQVGVTGDLNFALSNQNIDPLLASAMNGTWVPFDETNTCTTAQGALTWTITTTGNGFANIPNGAFISISGFVNSENNGVHLVYAKPDDNTLQLLGIGHTVETSVAGVQIEGNHLVNGTDVSTFTIQKQLNDAGNRFLLYQGCYATGFTLNIAVGDFVNGTISLVASDETEYLTDQTSGANAAPAYPVYNTVGDTAISFEGGAAGAHYQSLELTVTKNNARSQYAIGSPNAIGMGRGTFEVSGTITAYFQSFTDYTNYKNETEVWLNVTIDGSDNESYRIRLNCRLMNPTIVAGGADQDVLATFDLEGHQGPDNPFSIPTLAKYTMVVGRIPGDNG